MHKEKSECVPCAALPYLDLAAALPYLDLGAALPYLDLGVAIPYLDLGATIPYLDIGALVKAVSVQHRLLPRVIVIETEHSSIKIISIMYRSSKLYRNITHSLVQ